MNKVLNIIAGVIIVILAGLAWHYYSAYVTISTVQVDAQNSSENIFQVASSTGDAYFTVTSGGNIGVNTTAPTTALDVRGAIRTYIATSTSCTVAVEGAIIYSGYVKHFFGCDGTAWHRLDQSQ